MKASVLAEKYLSGRVVSDVYAANLRRIAQRVGVLSVESCNRYLRKRMEEVRSTTVYHERAILWGLFRWACDDRIIDSLPRGLVRIKQTLPAVRAWKVSDCCTLVKRCEKYDSVRLRTGANLGKFFRCWLLLGYESGARMGDLWRMRDSDFEDGALIWQQSKTGTPITKVLSDPCVEAVSAMLEDSPDGRVLGWALSKSRAGKRMRAFLDELGMRGSSKWLRRSSATHIEAEHPGKGRLHLGHKTIGLAEKHYIDWTQVRRDIPQPPCLVSRGG